nr:hypothetical protein Itr_chr06CG18120 [Ipomoea trifida]
MASFRSGGRLSPGPLPGAPLNGHNRTLESRVFNRSVSPSVTGGAVRVSLDLETLPSPGRFRKSFCCPSWTMGTSSRVSVAISSTQVRSRTSLCLVRTVGSLRIESL